MCGLSGGPFSGSFLPVYYLYEVSLEYKTRDFHYRMEWKIQWNSLKIFFKHELFRGRGDVPI